MAIPRDYVPLKETKAGLVVSVILAMVSMGALCVCLSRRVESVRDWSRLPLVCWLVLLIYLDSIAFVLGAAILQNGFRIDSSKMMCSRAVLLCLACYMTTKLLYYFLVERAYIIRRSSKSRLKDKLYLFNAFGMLIPYLVVIALNFYFRFAVFDNGSCRIGMKRVAMIPLIGFDILVNVYLTSLFLIPLRSLYSYRNDRNSQVRIIALRTFVGSCCTLTSSVVNLTMVMVLNGEPGWICLMCCNFDIFFSVLVLHWITSKDNASTMSSSQNRENANIMPNQLPSPPKRLVPRPPLSEPTQYELGLREWQKVAAGGVVTLVSAKEPEDELALDRISTMPPNVVTVETDHVREVEHVKEGRTSISNVSDEQRSGKTGSSDDLCSKVD